MTFQVSDDSVASSADISFSSSFRAYCLSPLFALSWRWRPTQRRRAERGETAGGGGKSEAPPGGLLFGKEAGGWKHE